MAKQAEDNPSHDPPLKIGGTSFVFEIDAFTPQTMPAVRLGEYMAALAKLMGEPADVHFEKLTTGSACLNFKVERKAAPSVRARAESVRRGDAPAELMENYRTINKMLRDDHAVANFKTEKKGQVLSFPGRNEILPKVVVVRQLGTFDGRLMRIGGTDKTIHLMLISEDQRQSKFVTNRATAKSMAAHMFEYMRVIGRGAWQRDESGDWTLLEFIIDSFIVLDDAKLSEAVADLRRDLIDTIGQEAE